MSRGHLAEGLKKSQWVQNYDRKSRAYMSFGHEFRKTQTLKTFGALGQSDLARKEQSIIGTAWLDLSFSFFRDTVTSPISENPVEVILMSTIGNKSHCTEPVSRYRRDQDVGFGWISSAELQWTDKSFQLQEKMWSVSERVGRRRTHPHFPSSGWTTCPLWLSILRISFDLRTSSAIRPDT